MEPKPCNRCHTNPRRKNRSYCEPCDKYKQRVRYHRTAGRSWEEIAELEATHQAKQEEDALIETRIAELASERAAKRAVQREVPDDTDDWTQEEVDAFNRGFDDPV